MTCRNLLTRHFRQAWLCDMASRHMAACSGDLLLVCNSMLAWYIAHNLFWVVDIVFVCSLQSRVSLGNHVPQGFYIVAAMPDLYPSDRNKHSQPLKTKYPAPWKQDGNYSLSEYWLFSHLFHFFFCTFLFVVKMLLDPEFESDSATYVLCLC